MIFTETLQSLNTILSSDFLINSRYDIVSNFNKLNTYASETSAGIVQKAYIADVESGEGNAFISPEMLRTADLEFAPKLNFDLELSGATPDNFTSAWCTNVKYVNDKVNEVITSGLSRVSNDQPIANNLYQLGGDGSNLNTSYTNRWKGIFAEKFYGTATYAQYADIAENYLSTDDTLIIGELVSINCDEDPNNEISRTDKSTKSSCIGVVSDKPGVILRSNCEGIPIALVGRTPTYVLGPIKKGQRIEPSDIPGVAKVADLDSNYNIGIALDSISNTNDIVKIMCLIKN